MAQLYQNGFGYLSGSGTPSTGSFTINNAQWDSATTISIHDIPFDNFGPGGITGSADANFSSYYSNLGPGSVIFLNYSESVWSYDVDSISDSTGYTTFTVTNLTGPAISPTPGVRPIIFNILPAGAGAQIDNNANNRVLTATGVQGEINGEAKLTFDGTVLSVNSSNSDVHGLRFYGGVNGAATPYFSPIGFSEIFFGSAATGFVFDFRRNKIAFDSDSTNTFIQADASTPENLEIHADGDIELNADNDIVVPNMGVGTDNSVVILTANNELRTDEIDSRVWGSSLVDYTGTPVDNQVAIWTDSNTIEGVDQVTWDGTEFRVEGVLSANEKNFDIKHPTKEGWRLRYSVLEGPERGVYTRGRVTGEGVIELPDYWSGLIYEDSITVQLTPAGKPCTHYVDSVNLSQITIGCECGEVDAFYIVHAERKAEEPVLVEYQAVK